MKGKPDFFIGWQEKTPPAQKKALTRFLIPIFILLPILAYFLVSQQKAFNDHKFELGNISEIRGIYIPKPVPVLLANPAQLPEGIDPHILLVGYGKFGAEGIMEEIEEENGNFYGKEIKLAGTLIYGDGKAVMELTEKAKSFRTEHGMPSQAIDPTPNFGPEISFEGEILDPKCYFGVMKPGEGKIHKSCAIRCISGGIPPVLRVKEDSGTYEYYILQGPNEKKINQDVLAYIGEPVRIKGRIAKMDGWNLMRVDLAAGGSIVSASTNSSANTN